MVEMVVSNPVLPYVLVWLGVSAFLIGRSIWRSL